MSLSRIKRCATCRKTEDEVEIRTCSRCEVITYCSDLCENANEENHQKHCDLIVDREKPSGKLGETTLKIAMIYDNYQALESATGCIEIGKQLFDESDIICFYIELGSIDKAIECRNKWYKKNGVLDEESIWHQGHQLNLRGTHEKSWIWYLHLKMSIGLSGLVLDLFLLNQMEAFEAFWSTLDGAPHTSSAQKLRWVDLVTTKIKNFVLGPGIEAPKMFLEMRIQEEFRFATKGGTDFDFVNSLLNPEPFDFYSFERRDIWRRWFFDYGDPHYHQKILQMTQYHRRIIQRLPWAQNYLKQKILEEKMKRSACNSTKFF